MPDLSPERIAELERLLAEATPGPWVADFESEDDGSGVWNIDGPGGSNVVTTGGYDGWFKGGVEEAADAALIVAAVDALPALLAELNRAWAAVKDEAAQTCAALEERAALLAERERQRTQAEGFIGVLRSNQDTLLHKVPRTEAVRLQLEVNLAALVSIRAALEGTHHA